MQRSPGLTVSRRLSLSFCSLTLLTSLVASTSVHGYHFFYRQNLAARWANLPVNLLVDNAPASFQADVQAAVNTWNGVATARDVFGTITQSGVDFTGANFRAAWGNMPAGGDGQQEAVFDADGSAISATGRNPDMVNGVAPSRIDIVGGQPVIVDAYLIVNGSRGGFDRR